MFMGIMLYLAKPEGALNSTRHNQIRDVLRFCNELSQVKGWIFTFGHTEAYKHLLVEFY
jgi:hypothetical protein